MGDTAHQTSRYFLKDRTNGLAELVKPQALLKELVSDKLAGADEPQKGFWGDMGTKTQ